MIKAARAVLPPPLVTKKGRRGHTDFYRCTQGLILAKKFRDPEGMMLLEVLGSGQTVIPPTIHPETKLPYEWLTENTLLNTHVEELPLLDDDIIEQIERALAPHLPKPKVYVRPQANTHFVSAKSERMRSYALAALGGERRTLGSMPHRPSSRNRQLFIATWKVGKYVAHSVLTEAELRQDLMQAASSCGLVADDGPDACQATISSGLFKSSDDDLPLLEDRPPPKKNGVCNGFHASAGDEGGASSDDGAVKTWPVLENEARHGIVGEIAKLATEYSEADPVAVIASFLVWFAALLGRVRYFNVGDGEHHARLFMALVGRSSLARKGTSLEPDPAGSWLRSSACCKRT